MLKESATAGAKRSLLYVAFDFPPQRSSGVYRHLGFTRYLPQYGWQPTVLTAQGKPGYSQDPSLAASLPSLLPVHRTSYFDLRAWEKPAAGTLRNLAASTSQAAASPSPAHRVLRQMGDWLRSSLYFPDDTVGWVPFALLRALELHFAHPFDLVYTSSPPRSAPLIGYLLKRFLGLRWVAEFRDPWYLSPRPFRSRADAWLLRCLLRRADRVVVISEGHAEELERAHGLRPDHLAIISNGFDEGDFQPEPPPFHPAFAAGFIHLSHFGAVYPRFSGNFFRALAEVLQEQPEARRRLRVNIVGFPDETCLRYAQENALGDVVKIHDFMGHSESLQAMAASRCLLLFLANKQVSRLSGLGKIYWYLRVGRPILAVASEGGTKNLVEAGQAGWVVEPEDTEGLKGVLRQLLRQEWNGSPPRPLRPEFVSQFRYDRLVEKLARTLSEVAVRGR